MRAAASSSVQAEVRRGRLASVAAWRAARRAAACTAACTAASAAARRKLPTQRCDLVRKLESSAELASAAAALPGALNTRRALTAKRSVASDSSTHVADGRIDASTTACALPPGRAAAAASASSRGKAGAEAPTWGAHRRCRHHRRRRRRGGDRGGARVLGEAMDYGGKGEEDLLMAAPSKPWYSPIACRRSDPARSTSWRSC